MTTQPLDREVARAMHYRHAHGHRQNELHCFFVKGKRGLVLTRMIIRRPEFLGNTATADTTNQTGKVMLSD